MKNFLGIEKEVTVLKNWLARFETPTDMVDVTTIWQAYFKKAMANCELCPDFYGFFDGPFDACVTISGNNNGRIVEFCPYRMDFVSDSDRDIDALVLSTSSGDMYLLDGAYIKN